MVFESPESRAQSNRQSAVVPDIVDGEEYEEEVGEAPQLEHDFEFIEEVLGAHVNDIMEKPAVAMGVEKAMLKAKSKIPSELKETTLESVKTLEENFKKVIGFASKSRRPLLTLTRVRC